jgi:hypothetical protein
VVARRPDDAGESPRQDLDGEREVLNTLADITGDDEPVVGVIRQSIERRTVLRVRQMQITDRE